MRHYAVTRNDGGVMILTAQDSANPAHEIDKMNMAEPGRYLSFREIAPSDCPPKDEFRAAWKPDLSIDLNRAKAITKERLEREAKALTAVNDAALVSAMAENDGQAKAAALAERARLNNVAKLADSASSIAELKALKATK